MKARYGVIKTLTVVIMLTGVLLVKTTNGQITMGVLPVNVPTGESQEINSQVWQALSSQIHEYLVLRLTNVGDVKKLSREHIVLLLKEMSSQAPEDLDIEAYKTISRKEKMDYLLKCSVESFDISGKTVNATVRIIIIDGSNGKMFWEKTIKTVKTINETPSSRQILMDQVFKPALDKMIKEILTLKY